MDRDTTFVVLQGTNFVALVLMAMIAWTRLLDGPLHGDRCARSRFADDYRGDRPTGLSAPPKRYYLSVNCLRATTGLAMVIFAVLVGLDLGRIYSYRTIATGFPGESR